MGTLAHEIVKAILKDLQGRAGLRQEWEQIDPNTQQEIQDAWEKIVQWELDGRES